MLLLPGHALKHHNLRSEHLQLHPPISASIVVYHVNQRTLNFLTPTHKHEKIETNKVRDYLILTTWVNKFLPLANQKQSFPFIGHLQHSCVMGISTGHN
jgi:hypothetical protein